MAILKSGKRESKCAIKGGSTFVPHAWDRYPSPMLSLYPSIPLFLPGILEIVIIVIVIIVIVINVNGVSHAFVIHIARHGV